MLTYIPGVDGGHGVVVQAVQVVHVPDDVHLVRAHHIAVRLVWMGKATEKLAVQRTIGVTRSGVKQYLRVNGEPALLGCYSS